MSPGVKYTLARIGLLLLAVGVMFALPIPIDPLVRLMVAIFGSAVLSWHLLRRWREEWATEMVSAGRRRAEAKARLRAALAGDDDSGTAEPSQPADPR